MTEKSFKQKVWRFYKAHGRDLPWRETADPYKIWVSEIMLQQTQVDRVIPKYEAFVKKFPTAHVLAKASLGEVLLYWQGLGYNRRAKLLHTGAKHVCKKHDGLLPKTTKKLEEIPGIGPYTAAAIQAFAFNAAVVCIETNIRTVFLYHFFPNTDEVSDAEILPLIKKTMSQNNPRDWYAALMDYGAHLKRSGVSLNTKSKHYTKQKAFKGSAREIRGALVRETLQNPRRKKDLLNLFPGRENEVERQLQKLSKEELLTQRNGYWVPAT